MKKPKLKLRRTEHASGFKNISHKPMDLKKKFRTGFLELLDKRSAVYRVLNEAYEEYINDLGGEESLSHAQKALIERFVFIEFSMRVIEQKVVANPTKNCAKKLGRLVHGAGSLTSIGKTLGLMRKTKKGKDFESRLKIRRA